jgi:amino acid adenylation domain-containing protein
MVPGHFVQLGEMPLTPNGKVDRKALPAPERALGLDSYVAPAGGVEKELAEIWGEVLRHDANTISAGANFFELGGHSLAAMRLMTRVLSRFGAEIPLQEIFEEPTLSGFARRIGRAGRVGIPRIEKADREAALPVSFAQQRLWIIDQIDGDSSQYNLPVGLRLSGRLNRRALQQALDTIVERHEVLRTTFVAVEGAPRQVVHAAGGVNIGFEDLSSLGTSEQEARVRRLAQEEGSRRFDLERDPMLRVTLVGLSEEEHVALFTQHHIASDGWSVAILVREFSALYRAYSQEQKSPLPELPIQYADYAHWQRQWLQGEVLEEQMGYWREQLAGAPLVHDLPLDKVRPAKQGFAGAWYWQELDGGLLQALKALCRGEDVTLFMLLETVFALLVSRYSHERDVVIGTPAAGRLQEEVEPLIGFFLNNLALRSRFDGNMPFGEALARQREVILGAYAHQHVPFEVLVEQLNPERSLSHDPIFQIVFSLNNNESEELSLPDLRVGAVEYEGGLAKVDLEVMVTEREERLSVGWTYRTDLFASGSIAGLAASYERLLRGIVAEPKRGIYEYPLVDAKQEEVLGVKGGGDDQPNRPGEWWVHERFAALARRVPEAVAVVYGEQRLSYGELNEKAERLARYLVEAGVRVESRVGIYLGRSLEMMIGVLGVMKAGGTYVPLEPGLPRERVKYMMEDAGIEWVLVESEKMESLPLGGVDVVLMDGAGSDPGWLEEAGEGLVDNPGVRVRSEDLAYILYTSGSTGKPKGVMVPHGGLANYVGHAAGRYLGEGIVGGVVSSPLSFDATLTTLLGPLACGKRVELLAEDEGTLERLAEKLFEGGEGWLFKITPAHLEALEYVERGEREGRAGHRIVVGGEQLGAQRLKRWKGELLPNAVFVNEYGPTEAAVGCSVWEVRDREGLKELEGLAAAPIGRPIGNTQLYVLGEGRQLQPVNSVGELYIGGAGLARGYLGQEELTRERFIDNPFSGEAGSRLYRTGDLVRWLGSGELMFVGRRDQQVKVRGYRIELGEIEAALLEHGGVKQAVAVAREDEAGEKRLVAYVVSGEGWRADTGALRSYLQQKLPEYMVPGHFVQLGEMPLTPNGKVDRKALPAPDGGDAQKAAYVAPRNEIERALCEVWQEVLKRERVGVQDNFFSLGGDSILSIRVVSMLRGRGVALNIKDLFQYQTLEQLAAQALSNVDFMMTRMKNDAVVQKKRLLIEGKNIEEGVFL